MFPNQGDFIPGELLEFLETLFRFHCVGKLRDDAKLPMMHRAGPPGPMTESLATNAAVTTHARGGGRCPGGPTGGGPGSRHLLQLGRQSGEGTWPPTPSSPPLPRGSPDGRPAARPGQPACDPVPSPTRTPLLFQGRACQGRCPGAPHPHPPRRLPRRETASRHAVKHGSSPHSRLTAHTRTTGFPSAGEPAAAWAPVSWDTFHRAAATALCRAPPGQVLGGRGLTPIR